MGDADPRPWLARYDAGMPSDVELEHESALAMFAASVRRAPAAPLVHYLDSTLTVAELDAMSDALAVALTTRGFGPGDRLAVYLQNVPQYLVAMLAAWKAGGIMVSINPMYRQREVTHILNDSGARVLVCLESLWEEVAAEVVPATSVTTVITTSELDFVADPDAFAVLKAAVRRRPAATEDLLELVAEHHGATPAPVRFALDDTAFLTYTSGTTGPAKGAMNTHRNVVFTAQAYRDWIKLSSDDVVLGVAPLFHITGLIGHMALALLTPLPLVLTYRFEPQVMFEMIQRWRVTFTIGAITAFTALMHDPSAERWDLSSLRKVYTGGQPVPAAIVDAFKERFGLYIYQAYGLTETTSPSHFVPLEARSPADPASGCLAVGVPIFNTLAKIVDDNGKDAGPGAVGEIAVKGPQVVPGYWEKPQETAAAYRDGWFLTGDVGLVDEQGWFYVIDRKKDQINAAGFKIWPREVEDVLCEHPAVREAAVVGVPDGYRGESVKAFVSLKAGAAVTPRELQEHCRERMAAYKYPRSVEILDELPKTASGKILRRELRQAAR